MTKTESKLIVGVVAKTAHPGAKEAVISLLDYLTEHSIRYRVDTETAKSFELNNIHSSLLAKREDLSSLCSPIVVMGGDGTLISVSRHPAQRPPIIIGVNFGTLGFLTEIRMEEIYDTLEAVLDGNSNLERRSLLSATVLSKDKQEQHTVINDLVISKQALARIFAITVEVNGEFAAVIRGDGALVATPSGSTAYSLAAGGSIVHPQVDAILLTPICPHSLTLRPLVLPSSSTITLTVDAEVDNDSIFLTLDGQEGLALSGGDKVSVTTSSSSVLFAKSPTKNYYEILGTKLTWATRPVT